MTPELVAAFGAGVLLLAFYAFQWSIIDAITVFGVLLIQRPILLVFGASCVLSVIHIFLYWKKVWFLTLLPLTINIATLLIIAFVPFTEMSVNADFHLKLLSREDIVQQVKVGALKNNVAYNNTLIHLPAGYPYVSSSGNDILVEGENGSLSVFFFTFRGVLDNFAGIIYKENDQPPTASDFGCDTLLESSKFQDNWFWMSCT